MRCASLSLGGIYVLTIPAEHLDGLSLILRLNPEEETAIKRALGRATSPRTKHLMDLLLLALPTLAVKNARQIAATLRSMYNVRTSLDLTVDAFTTELLEAAKKHIDAEIFDPARAQHILTSLLNVLPLSLLTKARSLHLDHKNIFCSAKVISDMRPVFDVEIDKFPGGFTIVHTLKLGFHQRGKHAEMYVAMDKQDIQELIDVLQRAQRKAATLAQLGDEKGLSVLAE